MLTCTKICQSKAGVGRRQLFVNDNRCHLGEEMLEKRTASMPPPPYFSGTVGARRQSSPTFLQLVVDAKNPLVQIGIEHLLFIILHGLRLHFILDKVLNLHSKTVRKRLTISRRTACSSVGLKRSILLVLFSVEKEFARIV